MEIALQKLLIGRVISSSLAVDVRRLDKDNKICGLLRVDARTRSDAFERARHRSLRLDGHVIIELQVI